MLKNSVIGRSVLWNWGALVVSFGTAFFLSPFIVLRLGDVGYGVWTLVNSMIAYMGLMDLGLRGAVTRFVSKHHACGEHRESSQVVSAALWLRLWIGIAIVVVSLLLPVLAIPLFRIPTEMQAATRWAIGITGTSFAITLTMGVFGGVLVALNRFDCLSAVNIVQAMLRTAGIVWLLNSGYGIVGLALWEFAIVVVCNAALIVCCFKVYPDLGIRFQPPGMRVLRQLWGYSFYALLFSVCGQIVYYTDALVVGAFVSAGAVTYFAIAGGLLEYARQVVAAIGTTIFPLASRLDAQRQSADLQHLLIQGTRATLLVALPIQVALFFRGPTFISLWVGDEYAHISGRVLQILLIAHGFAIANYASYNIVWGLGKHKPVALLGTLEAASNAVLSVVLVRRMGLEGVAWGTVIPSLALQVFFWPRFICATLNVPIREYIWHAWIRCALAVCPFAAACYFADRLWVPTDLIGFFAQMVMLVPALILGIALCFAKEICNSRSIRVASVLPPARKAGHQPGTLT